MSHRDGSDAEITSPEDRRLIEAIAKEYQPGPMDALQQAAFRRRLGQRLERRGRLQWMPAFALAATAVAAVLWLTIPHGSQPKGSRIAAAGQSETSVLYAFVDPDDYDGSRLQPKDFLPDDYVALASALDVPVDNP
jgi:hypothetical protein